MKSLLSVSRGRILPLIACLLLAPIAFGQQPDEADEGVTVERVVDKGLTRIKIPAQDGKVAWEDVLRALTARGAHGRQRTEGQISLRGSRSGAGLQPLQSHGHQPGHVPRYSNGDCRQNRKHTCSFAGDG